MPPSLPAMELGDEAPTALYRLFSGRGRLLYVGITGDIRGRLARHAREKPWWPDVARKTVEWHLTREDAAAAELAAIRTENPVYNIQGAAQIDLEKTVSAEDVAAVALREMPPTALRLALLEMVGIGTDQALDLLGVRLRQNRARVKLQRAGVLQANGLR